MRARRPSSAMPKPSLQPFQVMWRPVLMWLVAGWDEVMWLVVDVMSCHLMRCVTLLLCYVTWLDGVLWGCDAMWLVAMSHCVVRSGCVMWWLRQMIWWSVLQSPTILQTTTWYYFGFGSWWNHVWTVFGSCSNCPPLLMTLHPFSALFFQKNWDVICGGRRNICWRWMVRSVAPRNVHDVSCVTRINHEICFSWPCNIWCRWRMTPVAPRIVLDISCVRKINHKSHFSWQGQYLVTLDGESCC